MKTKIAILTLSILSLASVGQACTAETVINADGSSSVRTICENGGTYFEPGGQGGSCSTVIIPGKGAVLLCK
jgi:hypothetical protein